MPKKSALVVDPKSVGGIIDGYSIVEILVLILVYRNGIINGASI